MDSCHGLPCTEFLFPEAAFLSFKKTADVVPVPSGGKSRQERENKEEGERIRKNGSDDGKTPERNEGCKRNIPLQFQQGKPDDSTGRGKEKGEGRMEEKNNTVGGSYALSSPETEP